MFKNYTPHEINVFDSDGTALMSIPSEGNARCAVSKRMVGTHEGVDLFVKEYGDVEGMAEPEEGTIYIVSLMVRERLLGRLDVASPGDLIRDADGKAIGCKGLDVNSCTE